MITDLPDHVELGKIGRGWLNLAWSTAVEAIGNFAAMEEHYLESGEGAIPESKQTIYWESQSFALNNAAALTQQAVEILLKSKIVEVSPFLLLAGDWKKDGSFNDMKTREASHLCNIVVNVSRTALPDGFEEFFDRMRKQRNRIIHLSAGNIKPEGNLILQNVLQAFRFLFPAERWLELRKQHLEMEHALAGDYDDDWSHTNLLGELKTALDVLDLTSAKTLLDYDPTKAAVPCPVCAGRMAEHAVDNVHFAQRRGRRAVGCIACGTDFTAEEYAQQVAEHWGSDTDDVAVYSQP